MYRRGLAAAALAAAVVVPAGAVRAADDATLLRVFLKDGSSLVSYGEPARVNDRVIFSMPTAPAPNPPLHLVNLPLDRIDWQRTERYAAAARATHYLQTQAEIDYAALSTNIAGTLNDVAAATDPAERLAIVERARKALSDWPQNHYNYRQADVRQMVAMLDEAIADLRAAAGARRFDLALTAYVDPPTISEPLLPSPTLKESIEQGLLAAKIVDNAAERTSLLATVMAGIDRGRPVLPDEWATATRLEAEMAMRAEQRVDQSYRSLTKTLLAQANRRARLADVRGLERLLRSIPRRDSVLGGRRPEAVSALVAAVAEKLDAARRLQLARDRWAMRAPALHHYQGDIAAPLTLIAQLGPALENIKALSGSTPAALRFVERTAATILKLAGQIVPPEELVGVHALLVSAAQLSANAAQIRREAALAGDLTRAWNASSAAAGALMLAGRARSDMQAVVRPPQLR
jgi:hypothetical protein